MLYLAIAILIIFVPLLFFASAYNIFTSYFRWKDSIITAHGIKLIFCKGKAISRKSPISASVITICANSLIKFWSNKIWIGDNGTAVFCPEESVRSVLSKLTIFFVPHCKDLKWRHGKLGKYDVIISENRVFELEFRHEVSHLVVQYVEGIYENCARHHHELFSRLELGA